MTVCQGCGRSCNSDLCCPTCTSLDRSSFFCSQDCFGSNWKEHCKLHAILKQQKRMTELDNKEKKLRGLSAASSAMSAIADLIHSRAAAPVSPRKVQVAQNKPSDQFKDHEVKPLDKLIGPNGIFRGFRVIVLSTLLLFGIFFRINSLISEIPVVVEKKVAEKRVMETLAVQANVGKSSAVLVSANAKPAAVSDEPDSSDVVKKLRGEVQGLKEKLSMLQRTPAPPIVEVADTKATMTELDPLPAIGVPEAESLSNSTLTELEPLPAIGVPAAEPPSNSTLSELDAIPGIVRMLRESPADPKADVGVVRSERTG